MGLETGQSLTSDYIGNQFPVQQLFGSSTYRLNELYAHQHLFCGRVSIKLGRLNGGNDFLQSPLYYHFITNAMDGNPIAVFFQTPFVAYPNATWGAVLQVEADPRLKVKFGLYNGNLRQLQNRFHGMNFTFKHPDGLLFMTEWAYMKRCVLEGNYRVGVYGVTADKERFAGGKKGGSYGYYFLLDQQIYRRGCTTITPFTALLFAPGDRNEFPFFGVAAVVGKGLWRCRPDDSTNFGVVWGAYSSDKRAVQRQMSEEVQDFEMQLELNHFFQVTPWFQIAPCIQYVVHPKGLRSIPNALVVGVQIHATL